MNLERMNKIKHIADSKNCQVKIVNDQDGVTVFIRGRKGSPLTETGAALLQAELHNERFETAKKYMTDGMTVLVYD